MHAAMVTRDMRFILFAISSEAPLALIVVEQSNSSNMHDCLNDAVWHIKVQEYILARILTEFH
jgi:hypothetical protein